MRKSRLFYEKKPFFLPMRKNLRKGTKKLRKGKASLLFFKYYVSLFVIFRENIAYIKNNV